MTATLIRNGTIISMDDAIGIRQNCDLLIKDGEIVAIEPDLEADAEIIEADGAVILPGFVDTHRHMWQTVLRGILPCCSLGQYFVQVMGTYAPAFRAEDVYAGNLAGSFEALNAGITTIVDWCHCVNTPDHADAAIRALQDTGIRAMYGYGWPGGFEYLAGSRLGHPEDARRVRSEYFSSESGLLTFALALRGPATLEPDVNQHDFELARDLEARVTVHAGMRITGQSVREVVLLEEAGLLGPEITYVHCNLTPEEDLRTIAETGGTVSLSPYVEMMMGHGPPATHRILDSGLRPTLSVDVTTTSPGDMFTQMRSALSYGRIAELPDDRDVEFAPGLTAEQILRAATIDGAAACGLADRTGSLVPGKRADLMLIRTDQINMVPVQEPIAAVVTCADVSNIDLVMVDGRVVKRDGTLVDLDLPRVGLLAANARDHVMTSVAASAAS